jgi:DNA helicase-2/ATP-dependent DNA helicase PcrA
MKLVDLDSEVSGEKDMELKNFVSEEMEFAYIVEKILSSSIPRKEIFVLARTNNKLNELSDKFNSLGISHVVKKEDSIYEDSWEDKITLATVHSIKGLEAEMVFVVGCTSNNFPCKGSEHPVIEIVKVEEYDKEEEEQRLFYVAMSRAKKSLYLTYTGKKPTYFITDEMFKLLGSENINLRIEEAQKELETQDSSPLKGDMNGDVFDMLKGWRRVNSEKESVPAYCVLNDRTLKELAIKMPENLSEVESVNGIGPSKIEKYGEDILKIVKYGC